MDPVKDAKSRSSDLQACKPRLVRLKRGMRAQSLPLAGDPITIGRDPGNVIPVEDERASRNHAAVELRERGVAVRDLGSTNGTFVNERRVKNRPLVPGDLIRVGWSAFLYLADGMPQRARLRNPVGWLAGRLPDGAEVKWPVGGAPLLIGGASESDILLAEDGVCDYHALVAVRSGHVVLIELAPEPPRVTELFDGIELRFGATALKYNAEVAGEAVLIVHEYIPNEPAAEPARPIHREPPPQQAASNRPTEVAPPKRPVAADVAEARTAPVAAPARKPPQGKARRADSIILNLQCSDASLMGHLRAEATRIENLEAFPETPQESAPTRPVSDATEPVIGINDRGSRGWMLTVIRGKLAGKTLPIGGGPFSIGADAACALQLDDKGIADQHACIKLQEGVVILEDLDGSMTGVCVNKQQVRRQPLRLGDVIRIGETEMLVHL